VRGIAAVAATLLALVFAGHASTEPALRTCRMADLHVWVTHTGVGLGTVGGYLAFTNRSPIACRLSGWPKLTAVRPGASTTTVRVHATTFRAVRRRHGAVRTRCACRPVASRADRRGRLHGGKTSADPLRCLSPRVSSVSIGLANAGGGSRGEGSGAARGASNRPLAAYSSHFARLGGLVAVFAPLDQLDPVASPGRV